MFMHARMLVAILGSLMVLTSCNKHHAPPGSSVSGALKGNFSMPSENGMIVKERDRYLNKSKGGNGASSDDDDMFSMSASYIDPSYSPNVIMMPDTNGMYSMHMMAGVPGVTASNSSKASKKKPKMKMENSNPLMLGMPNSMGYELTSNYGRMQAPNMVMPPMNYGAMNGAGVAAGNMGHAMPMNGMNRGAQQNNVAHDMGTMLSMNDQKNSMANHKMIPKRAMSNSERMMEIKNLPKRRLNRHTPHNMVHNEMMMDDEESMDEYDVAMQMPKKKPMKKQRMFVMVDNDEEMMDDEEIVDNMEEDDNIEYLGDLEVGYFDDEDY